MVAQLTETCGVIVVNNWVATVEESSVRRGCIYPIP